MVMKSADPVLFQSKVIFVLSREAQTKSEINTAESTAGAAAKESRGSCCALPNRQRQAIPTVSSNNFIEFNGYQNGNDLFTISMPECGKRIIDLKISLRPLKFLQNAITF